MLTYVTGDLFESPAQTLVNTVNTVGVMGKGIALRFKQIYPEMFAKYQELCESGQFTIGQLYLWRTPNKWVLNFPTKEHWRRPSKLQYIEAGLEKFVEGYQDAGISSIAFPPLGCGNGELDFDEVRPLASLIVADARRAADIIARIRGMAAHKEPNQDLVDLGEVVQETIQFLHRELQIQGIKLNQDLVEKLPPVLGDRTQLQQVVLNLIMNAIHAVRDQPPDRRQLTVRVIDDRDLVRVDVEDLGSGIPEANRANLFEAFFTTKDEGLGLGLSICRSIIDNHGGEIGCEHLDTGTRFLFSVPVVDRESGP